MKTIQPIALLLFSIFFWTLAFLWMSFLTLVTLPLLFVFPYRKIHTAYLAPCFAKCIQLGFSNIQITYDPKFDPNRLNVFCQNHVNLLDAFVASAAIPHAFCGVMHSWQFHIPFYGWLMKLSKGIPVRPEDLGRTLDTLVRAAKDRVTHGLSILTFPEGHRTRDGKVHKFHRGVFLMAREAGLPVVPIAVKGSFEINQKGSWLFRPGTIWVYVGPQIETQKLSDQEIFEVAQKARQIIQSFVETEEEKKEKAA